MIGEVDASRGNTSSKVLGIGQVGAVVIAMIGLQHLQCQVGLGKGWVGACDTIGQSHPVEGGDIILFHGLDEVIDKLEHQVLAYIIVCLAFACIHIAGAPFANNDWSALADEVGLQVLKPCINLCFDFADGAIADVVARVVLVDDGGIVVNLEDDVVALTIGYLHLLQRVLQLGAPCTAATAGSVVVDNEVALGIVAACGTNYVDKTLGIVVNGIIGCV